MHYIFIIILLLYFPKNSFSQNFITKGKIEYEVKCNLSLLYKNFDSKLDVEEMPKYFTYYKELLFNEAASIYKSVRKKKDKNNEDDDSFTEEDETVLYTNLTSNSIIIKAKFMDLEYLLEDTANDIKWKLQNDTRKIAGFNCRKAVGIVQDTIYVVAFYSEEITPQIGPERYKGLPGTILGLAIPRLFTTWFATKLEVANYNEADLVAPTLKNEKPQTVDVIVAKIFKKMKGEVDDSDFTLEKVRQMLKGKIFNFF